MAHFILTYDLAESFGELRPVHRPAHLEHVTPYIERNEALLGGGAGDPLDQVVFLFQTDSADTVAEFARNDPYVVNGLVTDWRIKPWTIVAGAWSGK